MSGLGGCLVWGVPGLVVSGPEGAFSHCLVQVGVWSQGVPRGDPPAAAAGGTHPTGMHSCYLQVFSW